MSIILQGYAEDSFSPIMTQGYSEFVVALVNSDQVMSDTANVGTHSQQAAFMQFF